MNLSGRVALVTGGSGSLGGAICEKLAEAGCNIIVGYTGDLQGAKATAKKVESIGRKASVIQVDLTDPTGIDNAVDEAATKFGRLDVLINNGAWNIGIPFRDIEKITTEIWDRVFNTNVRGQFLISRAAVRNMRKTGEGGRIVNIASVAGLMPIGSSIAYASSKAALIHLTRCLAVAVGPEISVNCVAPGYIEGTKMSANVAPEIAQAAKSMAALKKSADMDDVANQVLLFCRSESITGQVLVVDGGFCFH